MLDHLGIVSISWPTSIRNYHQMAADTVYLKPQSQTQSGEMSQLGKVGTNNWQSERIMFI